MVTLEKGKNLKKSYFFADVEHSLDEKLAVFLVNESSTREKLFFLLGHELGYSLPDLEDQLCDKLEASLRETYMSGEFEGVDHFVNNVLAMCRLNASGKLCR